MCYRVALFSTGDALLITNREDRVSFMNPAAQAVTGWDENGLGKKLSEIFHLLNELTRQPIENPYSRVMRGGRFGEAPNHSILIKKNGMEVPIETNGAQIRDRSGNVDGIVLVFRDITKSRRMLSPLADSEVRYRRLFETAQDAILILNASSGRIIDANPFLVNLLGYALDELLGKELWEIGLFKDIASNRVAFRVLQEKSYIRYENLPLLTKDGRSIEVEFVSNVYPVENENIIQCNIRDITARKRAEKLLMESYQRKDEYILKVKEAQDTIKRYQAELETQNGAMRENCKQLGKLSELKDEFLRIASHNLKSPLACIFGYAAIIDRFAPPGTTMTQETHGCAAKISKQCQVMQKIIDDFLDFQALEDGQIKLTLEAVDLNDLGRDALERNAGYAATKMITSHLDLEPGPLLVNADKSRLNQVLENFISNAIKFSRQGEQVTVRARKTESGVLVEVRDSGPGLTNEDMKKLFVKYAKLSNMPTGSEKSSGLGLAICKKLIEIHGGKTGARNNPGGGATFWFELPGSFGDR